MNASTPYQHPDPQGIDLEFRPATYFRAVPAKPPGAPPAKHPPNRYPPASRPPRPLRLLPRNYVPAPHDEEVEILRVTIASTTSDETAVFAHRWRRGIFYRVVDEYDGLTLERPPTHTSTEPLTLRELMAYLDRVWSIYDVLALNFAREGLDARDLQRFLLDVQSRWYPAFESVYRHRIDAWGTHQRQRLRARRDGSD